MSPVPTSLVSRAFTALKLAGSAVRLSRTDDERVARNARLYLSQSMGGLRGLPQKIGQILSMFEAPEAEPFAPLRGEAEPLPFDVVESVLVSEWKRPVREVVAEIDPRGRAASLGQVHRARLHDGEEVAVKVQYPGMAKAVEADLKLLGWLSAPVGGLRRGFDLAGYREEILRDLVEELDYLREAAHQHRYGLLAGFLPRVVVPRVIGEHTTERVLVNRWETGESLDTVAREWPEALRRIAARTFLHTVLDSLFLHGFVQGDLHPGNFRFRREADDGVALVLYDFGCVYRPPLPLRLALLKLIQITEANGRDDPYPHFLELGFDPGYLEPIAGRLPALCRMLFEPFLLDSPFDLAGWRLGERVGQVLGEDRWNFRIAGPPGGILLMRVFHGLTHTLRRLGAPVSWRAPMQAILAHFGEELAALQTPAPPVPERGFAGMAKHLHIEVREQGQLKVRLTSPLHVVDRLAETMDPATLEKVRAQNIDLDELVRDVRRNGYRPQDVFRLEGDVKQVRVWLA